MKKYISCADTAKLVRQALKEAFPGVKFGVRSKTYSGGASITVGWTDGPNTKQVEAITGKFAGAYFDGMIDYKGSVTSLLNGEAVRYGADYIFTNRKYSEAMLARAAAAVAARYAGNLADIDNTPPVAVWPELYERGGLYGVRIIPGADVYGGSVQCLMGADLAKRSTVLAAASPTAGATFPLYDDGYGAGPVSNLGNGYPRIAAGGAA